MGAVNLTCVNLAQKIAAGHACEDRRHGVPMARFRRIVQANSKRE